MVPIAAMKHSGPRANDHGALVRHELTLLFPDRTNGFPWTTLAINVAGSFLLGVVLFVVFERRPPNRLLRPFLAIGLLGGFTTFSTFAVGVVQLGQRRPVLAAGHLAASVIGGPLAVFAGGVITKAVLARPLDRPSRGAAR